MDYEALAKTMLSQMFTLNKTRPQRSLNEGMRGEGVMLHYIILRGGAVQPSEISGFMGISSARMAAALKNLERKGLVTRRIDPDDRRRILVDMTDKGSAMVQDKQAHMLRHTTQMLEALGERDAGELVRLVGRVAQIMGEMHEGCDGP